MFTSRLERRKPVRKQTKIYLNRQQDERGETPYLEEAEEDNLSAEDKSIVISDVFFYSTRPNGSKLITTADEGSKWETLFDPQNTFGPFYHSIPKPRIEEYYFKGRWPLDYEDVMGVAPKHLRKSLARGDDRASIMSTVEDDAFLFPAVPNPTLPNLKHLKVLAHVEDDFSEDELESGEMIQVEIAPCPSISLEPKREEDGILMKERQRLFDIIQHSGFREELNGTCVVRVKASRAARAHRQMKGKADKMKREAVFEKVPGDTIIEIPREEMKEIRAAPSIASFRGLQEKVAEIELENQHEKTAANRCYLFYFLLGFLFPPLWILGFAFSPRFSRNQIEESKESDKRWRKYSRNAFILFILFSVATAITLIVLMPQSFGFRKHTGNDVKETVIFDYENPTLIT